MSVCGKVSRPSFWFYELHKNENKKIKGAAVEVSSVGSAILKSHGIFVTYVAWLLAAGLPGCCFWFQGMLILLGCCLVVSGTDCN